MKETSFFFKKFLAKRKEIGSILPSSNSLVKKITSSIPFKEVKILVELGGGTGAITRALIKNKMEKTKLLVFEPDEQFFLLLKKKFQTGKTIIILKEKAENLRTVLENFNLPAPDCIVCSLPFFSLGREKTAEILGEVKRCMKPETRFIFFQYTPLMLPFLLKQFKIKKLSYVILNAPPALLFCCVLLEKGSFLERNLKDKGKFD